MTTDTNSKQTDAVKKQKSMHVFRRQVFDESKPAVKR
jgi:hypothetical protein